MQQNQNPERIGIIGAGPAGMFMYKALIESGIQPLHITLFEKQDRAGMGMPYSKEGARPEHVTNVSANEIPDIVTPLAEWIKNAPAKMLNEYSIDPENFNEYKVLPRLLFGEYLAAQFELLHQKALSAGITTELLLKTAVEKVQNNKAGNEVIITADDGRQFHFDHVIISTGHRWPKEQEGNTPGWFDSPYPPSKLAAAINYPVAIKGASLTAIDAIKTLARSNGKFTETADGMSYKLNEESAGFRMVLHSLNGLMPAIRFHLEDTHLSQGKPFTEEEINALKESNGGFVPLDLVFDRNFKQPIREVQPEFYERIKDMGPEEFVAHTMSLREELDAFTLFRAEYKEAAKSIHRRQSVYWKEMLAVLSFEMNYAAKHFSAEDMIRMKKSLMPLISIIIAFVPQSSCEELIALHDAGVLSLQAVDTGSEVLPSKNGGCIYKYSDEKGNKKQQEYRLFVNATGQPAFMIGDFVFRELVEEGTVSEAHIRFREEANALLEKEKGNQQVLSTAPGEYWLKLPGITINDHFQVLDKFGKYDPSVYIMAVPYIAGLNPDYSGLDFCERASGVIVKRIMNEERGEMNDER